MDSIVRNIRNAEYAATLCSIGVLFVLESVVVIVCRRFASRMIRYTCIGGLTVPCGALYGLLLDKLGWSFASRIAFIEGLGFGWVQYWLMPLLTISLSLFVFRRGHRVKTAPN